MDVALGTNLHILKLVYFNRQSDKKMTEPKDRKMLNVGPDKWSNAEDRTKNNIEILYRKKLDVKKKKALFRFICLNYSNKLSDGWSG